MTRGPDPERFPPSHAWCQEGAGRGNGRAAGRPALAPGYPKGASDVIAAMPGSAIPLSPRSGRGGEVLLEGLPPPPTVTPGTTGPA